VLEALVATVADELDAYGDRELVADGLSRVLAEGGASRQRAAYERSGGSISAVVDDLVLRTNGQSR
jgi:carboxylate-amine ligase